MKKTGLRVPVLFLFIAVLLCGGTLHAQTPQAQPQAKADANPFANVPDAYFREADNFRTYCENRDAMNQYYNCDCMAFHYLEKRIQSPEASSSQIVGDIDTQCIDAAGAAGEEYERCLGSMPLLPAHINLEAYCKCYANTYAKSFEQRGVSVTSKAIVELQTEAHVACTDPALAKKLYPYTPPPGKNKN